MCIADTIPSHLLIITCEHAVSSTGAADGTAGSDGRFPTLDPSLLLLPPDQVGEPPRAAAPSGYARVPSARVGHDDDVVEFGTVPADMGEEAAAVFGEVAAAAAAGVL